MSDTYAATARSVFARATKAFAVHVLEDRGGRWVCRGPSGFHWFGLTVAPGMVAVWGDNGEAVFRHSDPDSLGWLSRAARHVAYPDYALSKIEAFNGDQREFYAGDALAFVKECQREADMAERDYWAKIGRAFRDALDEHYRASDAWFAVCSDHGVDDPPDCRGWSSSALWIWHALVTFVRLHQHGPLGSDAARNLAAAYHPHRDTTP